MAKVVIYFTDGETLKLTIKALLADQKLFLQHHTHWIPDSYPDEGKIILFNNQAGTPQGQNYSSVNIVELPVDVNGFYSYTGGAFGPTNFDWTYKAPTPTDFFSNITIWSTAFRKWEYTYL